MHAWRSLAVVASACYAPSPATGVACGPDESCPTPLVCAPATGTCERTRGEHPDAAPSDGAPIDTRPADAASTDDAGPACGLSSTHDEDSDGIVDDCDNCPGIANPTQANTTESPPDGVGDACDPNPTARDGIAYFESFATAGAWQLDPGVTITGDRLHVEGGNGHREGVAPRISTRGVVETRYTVTELVAAAPYSTVELVAERGPSGVQGYRCQTGQSGSAGSRIVALQTFLAPYELAYGTVAGARFAVGQRASLHLSYGGQLSCRASDPADRVDVSEPEARTGFIGLGTQYVGAAFDYVVVYEPTP